MPSTTFDNVQAFFEFLTVLNDATKRKTIDNVTVDLFTNLDPSGKTNTAIELAKIYTWYQNTVDYDPQNHTFTIKPVAIPDIAKNVAEGYWDETTEKFYEDSSFQTEMDAVADRIYIDKTSGLMFRYNTDASPAAYEQLSATDTTYAFRPSSTTAATFEYEESTSAGTWTPITIPNVATLVDGKVPTDQLPSYVDDVVEGYLYNGQFYKEAAHTTVIPPEAGKIYIDKTNGKCYRWSGSAYVEIVAEDKNMRQQLITSTDAKLRPLLLSYAQTSNSTENVDNQGYRMNTVYVDTSDGSIHAPKIVSDEIVDTATPTPHKYVHTGNTLILHANSRPDLW
jgi:hypothetical protein